MLVPMFALMGASPAQAFSYIIDTDDHFVFLMMNSQETAVGGKLHAGDAMNAVYGDNIFIINYEPSEDEESPGTYASSNDAQEKFDTSTDNGEGMVVNLPNPILTDSPVIMWSYPDSE